MTNAVVDRVDFTNAKLDGAKFVNAVVTGEPHQQGGVHGASATVCPAGKAGCMHATGSLHCTGFGCPEQLLKHRGSMQNAVVPKPAPLCHPCRGAPAAVHRWTVHLLPDCLMLVCIARLCHVLQEVKLGCLLLVCMHAGTVFDGADLSESVWEDALIGNEDVKRLCSNPTLTGESRFQVGCRGK